jgi:hypothetical protein
VVKILGKATSDWHTEMARWSDGGLVEPLDHATVRSWQVSDEARALLSEVGLPEFGSFFTPCPQAAEEPLLDPYYILGRESVDQHPHLPSINMSCGCGYFGINAVDGSVWQLFPDGKGCRSTRISRSSITFSTRWAEHGLGSRAMYRSAAL